jgi:hypothetical protein
MKCYASIVSLAVLHTFSRLRQVQYPRDSTSSYNFGSLSYLKLHSLVHAPIVFLRADKTKQCSYRLPRIYALHIRILMVRIPIMTVIVKLRLAVASWEEMFNM